MAWSRDQKKSPDQIIEELLQIIEQQRQTIEVLQAENARLKERVVELERRLGLNSSNSSMPPSSDGFKRPLRIQSLREKSGKKPGGQFGHKGSTLQQVEAPDLIERHKISCCPHCKTDLTTEPVVDVSKQQVFDIPKIKPFVTEHQFEVKRCPKCHEKVTVSRNGFTKAPVQYGPQTNATIAYLNAYNLVPTDRVAQIMSNVFSIPISTATVQKALKTCAANVNPIVDRIEKMLKASDVKGADESSICINGKNHWLHSLCNDQLVKYRMSEKRGDVPKDLSGVVIHDHFASYYSKMPGVQHALCNAHHLRELKAVTEIDKEPWAKSMSRLLLLGNRKIVVTHGVSPPIEWIKKYKTLYLKIIAKGLAFHDCLGVLKKPSRGKIKRRPGHNLLLRLQNRSEDVLRFLSDTTVPFTNNQSEQSLRMIKVKLKISGFRTHDGTEDFLAVRSYTATAQKQKLDVLDALTKAFYGKPINFA